VSVRRRARGAPPEGCVGGSLSGFVAFVAVWAIAFGAGCATPPSTAESHDVPRFELYEFSVQPPDGPEWSRIPIEEGMTFSRTLTGGWLQNFSLLFRVPPRFDEAVHPYDLLALARMKAASTERSERLDLLEHSERLVSHRGLVCAEFRFAIRDAGPPERDSVPNHLLGRGFLCIHPDDPHNMTEIEYSIRSLDGRLLEVDERIGNAFLESIRPLALARSETGAGSGTR
jgi:hypothetical protein